MKHGKDSRMAIIIKKAPRIDLGIIENTNPLTTTADTGCQYHSACLGCHLKVSGCPLYSRDDPRPQETIPSSSVPPTVWPETHKTWRFKGCPHCKVGDLYRDLDGNWTCLQCSRTFGDKLEVKE